MPTYEYRCTSCGNRFDVFQRLGEEPLRVCQRCAGDLRKVFHPAGIVFKGSGFYATDSRAKKAAGDGKAGSKTEPSTSESGAKKRSGTSSGKKAGEGSSS